LFPYPLPTSARTDLYTLSLHDALPISSYGDGVFRTTDGGKTWDTLGLAETRQISRVIVHPWNPDVVYVAALGFHGCTITREICRDRKSTRLNSSHVAISYAVFCLKKKK